ncbi:hypothetical protein JCM16303_000396 [Sporobolomyces ruberrimus]
MTERPQTIALPAHSHPKPDLTIPPTPSAFPSLSGNDSPSSLPASTLHYAQVTGKVLPPSSIPKGVSLPPPIHETPKTTTSSTNSRQPSGQQKNRDSPYARPGTGPRTTSGGSNTQQRRKPKPPPSEGKPTEKQSQENKRKSIPGMPPAWVAKNSKTSPVAPPHATHARRKSEGTPSFAMVKDKEATAAAAAGKNSAPGKKKRQTLGRTLTPSSSKLSALAPSFEFVPRSATSPNLSAYTQESSSGSGSDEHSGEDHEEKEEHEEEGKRTQSSDSTTTTHEEQEADPSSSSSLGSFLSSSFTLSTPDSLTSLETRTPEEEKKDPAEGLVDEELAAEIVSSSGPQADGFVGQTLTQSESGARPDADKTGFTSIAGVVNESPMADLEWKEKMGWWREDYDPKIPRVEEEEAEKESDKKEEEVVLAPAAVEANSDETPLLQFPPWTPSASDASTSNTKDDDLDLSNSTISPSILSEVLPNSFSSPPTSSSDETSTETPPRPASSFEETSTSSTSPPPPAASEPASSTSETAPSPSPPSLSSFLPTSFTPPLSGYPSTASTSLDSSFLSQDELRAEKLAHSEPGATPEAQEEEMPLSAEAVAGQATLDDTLDVEEIDSSSKEGGESVKEEKEVRKGWWNSSPQDDEKVTTEKNETEEPQVNQAEHSDQMVDPELAKEIVESAGAQADGFVAKGFEEIDRVGEEAQEGEKEVKKESEEELAKEESHRDIVDQRDATVDTEDVVSEEREEEQPVEKGASTPLSSYLSSAFQPSDTTFSSTSEEATDSNKSTADETPAPVSNESDNSTSTPVPAVTNPAPPARRSSSPPPPPERRPSESHAADSAPSLTLAISSAWHTAPWSRKIWAIIASVAINVGLPFVNGVMLGFGELFARNVLGVRFGWPLHNNTSTTASASSRANTGGVGLRSAGAYKTSNVNGGQGIGTDVPGHAGAKTALEGVVETVAE